MFIHKDRFASSPKVTFYVTTVLEIRRDTLQSTFSIDRCFASLAPANDRLGLLSRSNGDPNVVETSRFGEDYVTGCQWCTWTRPGAGPNEFYFFAEVKQITMEGAVRQADPSDDQSVLAPGGIASNAECIYQFEHKKDLAGHIWAVAVHDPDCRITVDEVGKPLTVPWLLESLHEASGNAMARGKRIWNEELKPKVGAFEKHDLHYGMAKYTLVPLSAGLTLAAGGYRPSGFDGNNVSQQRVINATTQVRVERLKVATREDEMAMFTDAAASNYNKPFQALCPGRERAPRLPRIESQLQALMEDAGEAREPVIQEVDEEEEEQEQLSGPTITAPSIDYVYEQWAAGPQTPVRVSRAPAWIPSETPAPITAAPTAVPAAPSARKRFTIGLGANIASIRKTLHNKMIAEHTRARLTDPTVDERGSPLPRRQRSGPEPELRLDTPGKVALATHQSLMMANRAMRM